MTKFNFKLANGTEMKAELVENDIIFEDVIKFKAKQLLALRKLYTDGANDFILDRKRDLVIPNKTFLHLVSEIEDELGYIHTRQTIDVVKH
jgi:hypothetical protein